MATIREWINLVESTKISDDWFKDGGFKCYKRPAKEKYRVADEPGTIQTLEGPVKYGKGFYILTGPKGAQGDGICTPKKIVKIAKMADHSGTVDTSWGEKLHYNPKEDIIVRHGENDYGVVKLDIFKQTYEKL
jgi:hypothetical protein